MQACSYGDPTGVTMDAEPRTDYLDTSPNVGGICESIERDVNLINIQGTAVNQRAERFASAFLLAGGDGHRRPIPQPGVTLHIAWAQRFFQAIDVEVGKRIGASQGGARVPHASRVDKQGVILADSFACAADQFEIERLALAHRFPAEFDGRVTGIDPTLADFFRLLSISTEEN